MADFSQNKKYNYNWQSSKFKNLALSGSYISQFINDVGYVTSSNAASSSYATSASYAATASYLLGSITSASHADQADNAAAIDIYSFSSPVDSYLLMSNVIATTGVAVGGDTDLRYNSSTNKLTVGTVSATSFTGSLLGTASYAVYAETASSSLNAQDILIYVKNQSGQNIAKGVVVRITGSNTSSDIPRIVTASYLNDGSSANTLGITNQIITNGGEGYVMTEGVLKGIDTNAFISGQLIYLGATGSIIGTAPLAPLHAVRLGEVVRHQSNNGSIYVRIDNGYELGELHDVLDTTTTSSYGDLLVKSGSVWTNSKQLTGSYGLTGSLNATSFTGSLLGTASYASQALSASYAPTTILSGPFGIANSSGSYTYYTTFSSSMAAATSGQTVEMFADVTETGSVTVTLKNGVNINGNGHTYTLNNSGLIHALTVPVTVETSCNILNLNVIRTGSTGSITDNSALILGTNGTGTINCAGSTFRNNGSGCGIVFNTNSGHSINYAAAYATTTWGAIGIFSSYGIKLNNSIGYGTSGGYGIRCHNGGDLQHCTGYSDSGYGIYGLSGNQSNSIGISATGNGFFAAESVFNCVGRSTSGIGFEAQNGVNITGCVGISVSGRGIATQNATIYNCTGISSSSSGVSLAGVGKAYNITAKSSTSYAMWGTLSTCQLYGGNILCGWNNAAGYGIRGNGGNILSVIANCIFNLSNASAPYLFNDGVAQAISMRGNTYQGGAAFNPNLTQAIVSTTDNQGNIFL